jgi:RNA polymerase-binding transcription factor DksA
MEAEKLKVRYSDAELKEFRVLIDEKIEKAEKEYENLRTGLINPNDVMDTSPTFKVLEEAAATLSKEELGILSQRQSNFIKHLKSALIRIDNKTYGICRETGKLIPKERLYAVPHATLCIEAKFEESLSSKRK